MLESFKHGVKIEEKERIATKRTKKQIRNENTHHEDGEHRAGKVNSVGLLL